MRRSGVLLVLLTIVSAIPAHARQEEQQGLVVAPFHVEQDLPGRSFEETLTYRNREEVPLAVRVRIRRLGHDLDGAPRHLRSARHEEAFRIDRSSFVIPPGAQERVRLRGAIPSDLRAIYLGVVAEFDRGGSGGSSVAVRSRVVSQFLLRAPKPWRQRLRVEDVGIAPGRDGDIVVYAVARNAGDVHVRPKGEIDIIQDGRVLDTVRIGRPPGVEAEMPPAIIPSFGRRLVGTWDPPVGLSGKIRLVARLERPRATGSGTASVGPGAQAPPAVSIEMLRAEDRGDGIGGIVIVQLSNRGEEPVEGVSVTLVATEGDIERGRTLLPARTLRPGLDSPQTWDVDLDDGTYLITAVARKSHSILDERVVDLAIGSPEAGAADERRSSMPTVLGGLLILLVGAPLLFVWLKRRRGDGESATRTAAR